MYKRVISLGHLNLAKACADKISSSKRTKTDLKSVVAGLFNE
jgi:hypothetical protein